MGIGAQDYIDRLLVDKYSSEKVDNHDEDALVSKVSAEDMMSAMNAAALQCRNMISLKKRLSMVCYSINAKSARYTPLDEEEAA